MKKKRIIITVVVVLLLLAGAVWFMIPRVKLYQTAREMSKDFPEDITQEYFNNYDATYSSTDSIQTVNHFGLSVDIPADWHYTETNLSSATYSAPDPREGIILMPSENMTDYSLLNETQVEELLAELPHKVGYERLMKGFESLDIGLPDSAFGTMKAAVLLEKDSYSLFNMDKTIAYSIMSMIKAVEYAGQINYVYETDKICGTYHISPKEDGSYYIIAEVFSAQDLNTVHTLIIKTKTLDTLYAMMNSVQINPE